MAAGFLPGSCSALSWVRAASKGASSFPPGAFSWTRLSPDALRDGDLCFLQLPELLALVICLSVFISAAQTLDCYTTVAELCQFKKPATHCPR